MMPTLPRSPIVHVCGSKTQKKGNPDFKKMHFATLLDTRIKWFWCKVIRRFCFSYIISEYGIKIRVTFESVCAVMIHIEFYVETIIPASRTQLIFLNNITTANSNNNNNS